MVLSASRVLTDFSGVLVVPSISLLICHTGSPLPWHIERDMTELLRVEEGENEKHGQIKQVWSHGGVHEIARISSTRRGNTSTRDEQDSCDIAPQ